MPSKQIVGLWVNKSKGGKTYYSSAKLDKDALDVLKGAKVGDKFLIFNVDKGDNEKRPDIHLTLAEDDGK